MVKIFNITPLQIKQWIAKPQIPPRLCARDARNSPHIPSRPINVAFPQNPHSVAKNTPPQATSADATPKLPPARKPRQPVSTRVRAFELTNTAKETRHLPPNESARRHISVEAMTPGNNAGRRTHDGTMQVMRDGARRNGYAAYPAYGRRNSARVPFPWARFLARMWWARRLDSTRLVEEPAPQKSPGGRRGNGGRRSGISVRCGEPRERLSLSLSSQLLCWLAGLDHPLSQSPPFGCAPPRRVLRLSDTATDGCAGFVQGLGCRAEAARPGCWPWENVRDRLHNSTPRAHAGVVTGCLDVR